MHRFNVFGKKMSIHRINGEWQLFTDSASGMRARVYDVVIPAEMDESEFCKFLDDIYHEYSSEKQPRVEAICQ
ncbi:DUF7661 family protein [Thalassotalea sp. ND16A]|uniref:DUF7661 family protein n=1 Tax=Thalassotalea sp. ND16A TaxID=1535422 RepID=UPI00051A29A4|nr:hypothetical protein [Thalassotalea sp. ND16A]KGJ99302.1 hypothetical protein ND16A_3823 [Thalassotalea sp. ND16A]